MVRVLPTLLLILCLAACQRGGHDTDAVRQGVVDHLTKLNYNVAGMDIKIADVQYKGDQAEATATITAKGQAAAPPMSLHYHMERQNGKWAVVSTGGGSNPHGGAMPPAASGTDNPHGGEMPPASGAGGMPSPHDLPPATKK